MKYYRFENQAGTEFLEYRTDGMQNSVNERIVETSYWTTSSPTVQIELPASLINKGFPNKLGADTTSIALTTIATSAGYRLVQTYESLASVVLKKNIVNSITSFSVAAQTGPATIDDAAKTIDIEVLYGTDVTKLIPAIVTSRLSTVDPASLEETDFTVPVVYTVTAEDGTEEEWTVTVTVADNTANDFLTFSLAEQTGAATIDTAAYTVDIEVSNATVVTALIATFTISPEATIAVGVTPQVSGTTANDFTAPVTYVITAQDGGEQEWVVTVTVAAA